MTLKRQSLAILLIGSILFSPGIFAEQKKDWAPTWIAKYSSAHAPIIADTGSLIVYANNNTIRSHNPQTGDVEWEVQLDASMPFDRMNFIPNSPYLDVMTTIISQPKESNPFDFGSMMQDASEPEDNTIRYGSVIINAVTGKIVFSSKDSFKKGVLSINYLEKTGDLLLFGIQDDIKKPIVGLFSSKEKRLIWSNNSLFGAAQNNDPFGGFMSSMTQEMTGEQNPYLVCPPKVAPDNSIIMASSKGIFKLDGNTGEQKWKADLPKRGSMMQEAGDLDPMDYNQLVLSPADQNNVYMLYNCLMDGYNTENGSKIWPETINPVNPVDSLIYTPKGMILLPATGTGAMFQSAKVYYVDYTTGKSLWPTDVLHIKGGVSSYVFTDAGLAIAQEDTNQANRINLIDLDQGKVIGNEISVHGKIKALKSTAKGLLYFSDTETNLIDLKTREKIWKETIQKPGEKIIPLLEDTTLFAYNTNQNKMVKADLTTGTVSTVFSITDKDLKNGLNIIGLDKIDNTIVLNTKSEIIQFDATTGKKLKTFSFESAKMTGLGGFLSGIEAIDSALYTAGDMFDISMSQPVANHSSSAYNAYNHYAQAASKIGFGSKPKLDIEGIDVLEKRNALAKEAKNYVALSVNYDFYGNRDDQWQSFLDLHNPLGLAIVNRITGDIQTVVYIDQNTGFTIDNLSRVLYVTSRKGLMVFAY